MRTLRHALLAILPALALAACGDDAGTSPTSRPTPMAGSFGSVAVGSWKADTTLSLMYMGVRLTPRLEVFDTLRADSTFSASLYVRNLMQNDVQGAVYVRSGRWSVAGDSLLVLSPATCLQAALDPASGLPFSMATWQANALAVSPCGAPDTVRTRPLTDGTWSVPLRVSIPAVDTASWTLTFRLLP